MFLLITNISDTRWNEKKVGFGLRDRERKKERVGGREREIAFSKSPSVCPTLYLSNRIGISQAYLILFLTRPKVDIILQK
jgi:hypothetical protein